MEHIAVQMVQNIAVLFAVTVIGIIDAPRASQQCQTGQFHIALAHILFFDHVSIDGFVIFRGRFGLGRMIQKIHGFIQINQKIKA